MTSRYLITIPGLAPCIAWGMDEHHAISVACDLLGLRPDCAALIAACVEPFHYTTPEPEEATT